MSRFRRRAVPLAALVAAALFALAFVTSLVPWLTRERTFISSTPTSYPVAVLAEPRLPPDETICVSGFGLDPAAEGVQFVVRSVASSPTTPRLGVEVTAPGYRSVTELAGGYPLGVPLLVALKAPARELDGARLCVSNEGTRAITFVGAEAQRELARVEVDVDGRTIIEQPWFQFVQRAPASILDRPGEILAHVAAFRPFPAVGLLLGVLALLVLVGVPLAVVGALALAQRTDGEDRT